MKKGRLEPSLLNGFKILTKDAKALRQSGKQPRC